MKSAYIAILLLISLCIKAQTGPLPSQKEKADIFFMEGHRQQLLGNHDDALELFLHSYALDSLSSATLYELSVYHTYLGHDSLGCIFMEKAVDNDPRNYWYKNALVNIYARQGRADDARRLLEDMMLQYPEKTEILEKLENIYVREQDYESVLRILNRIEEKEGKSEVLSLEKFRVCIQAGKKEDAFREIQSLIDEYPNETKYKVLIGDLYLSNGDSDKALQTYQDVAKTDSSSIYLTLSMMNYHIATGNPDKGQQLMEKAILDDKLDDDSRMKYLTTLSYQTLQPGQDSTRTLSIFSKLLSRPNPDIKTAELYAQYMVAKNMASADVKPVLHQALSIDPENSYARARLLQYAIEEEDTAAIISICKGAEAAGSDDAIYCYYPAVVYLQQKKHSESIAAARKGLDLLDRNKNITIAADFYSILGTNYYEIHDMEKVFEAYDSCLIYRPDDTGVNNNYAYYLSLEGRDLERAAMMVVKSLQREKDNPTYLDTYAWVLFMQEKYTEAREYIDRAITQMENDTTMTPDAIMYEHAGDICAKLGDISTAVSYWEKALASGSDHSALIQKKIKKRKYLRK